MHQQRFDVCGARIRIHGNHRHQHQHRAKKGIEEEFERRVDAVLTAPDPNDQEHWDQPCFEEQVEQHQIQRHEHAQHQRFQQQEGDHIFLDPLVHIPGGGNHQRHHEGGQHHKEYRNAVNAKPVLQPQQPFGFGNKLETGILRIKFKQHKQRDHKCRRCGDQRQPLGITLCRGIVPAQENRQNRSRQSRQKRDNGKQVGIH